MFQSSSLRYDTYYLGPKCGDRSHSLLGLIDYGHHKSEKAIIYITWRTTVMVLDHNSNKNLYKMKISPWSLQ